MNAFQAGEVSLCHVACEGTCTPDASDGPVPQGKSPAGSEQSSMPSCPRGSLSPCWAQLWFHPIACFRVSKSKEGLQDGVDAFSEQ